MPNPLNISWLIEMGYPFMDRRLTLIRQEMRVAERKGDREYWDRLTAMEAETIEARIKLSEGVGT